MLAMAGKSLGVLGGAAAAVTRDAAEAELDLLGLVLFRHAPTRECCHYVRRSPVTVVFLRMNENRARENDRAALV